MARPYIICLDDDLSVLNAVDRDLRQKYGREFRIVKSNTGEEALAVLAELQQRNEQVALFVVDQRMPSMTGVEFLLKAVPMAPDARKVLLTAYADTSAAITAINAVGLDYYLMKPWDPPEENLYPVLDGLLDDWKANTKPPFEGIRVFGAMWSPASHDAKNFLSRHSIPYQWLDVDRDPAHLAQLEELAPGAQLPVLLMPNGAKLIQPTPQEIAEQVGLSTKAENPHYDVVIIGAGPAGLSAAVYASGDGLDVLLIERQVPGGQAGSSPKIENFLGFPAGISGQDLTRRALTQAQRLGAEFLNTHSVDSIRLEGDTKVVKLSDGTEISAKIILIATGAWFRTLELPAMEKWAGAGVYYGAARTEAVNFKDTDVIAIGGANSAAQGILFLSKFVRSVKVLIRGQEPAWSAYLDTAIRNDPKVELMFGCELSDLHGGESIESVTVNQRDKGGSFDLPASAVFVFIGQKPISDFLGELVVRTPSGHILTGPDLTKDGQKNPAWPLAREPMALETSVPGIFAAGDVRNGTKHGVAAAAGDGNVAALLFWHYLSTI